MALMDMIKWDASPDILAWKFPEENIRTFSQLIVAESQEAVLFSKGQLLGKFGPGKHTLTTENLPLIHNLFGIPFGGKNPFTAEVWFINKAISLDIKWGTPSPIQLKDPVYQIMIPVRAYGQFGIQVTEAEKFLIKLVGTLRSFNRDTLSEYFKGLLLTQVSSIIAKKIAEEKIGILDITTHLVEISDTMKDAITKGFQEYGVSIPAFFVNSISVPEDDPAVQKLRDALARKAEMNILGTDYRESSTFDVMKTAAGNEGQGGMMTAGMGMGMGVNMGSMMAGMFTAAPGDSKCPHCGAAATKNARFCPSCGKSMETASQQKEQMGHVVCSNCGKDFPANAKFCPHCGDPYNPCPSCGADNPDGAKACVKCGGALPVRCAKCNARVAGSPVFCPSCGNKM